MTNPTHKSRAPSNDANLPVEGDLSKREVSKEQTSADANLLWLWSAAAVMSLAFACIVHLCPRFHYEAPFEQRPVLPMVILLALATAAYLAAVRFATRATQGVQLSLAIWIPAILFRVMFLPTTPIQEVDLYRYMWDGISICQGVSPFRYSPHQVETEHLNERTPSDLLALVEARDRSAARATILKRVHYGKIRTVYPPVSQLVFAFAISLTPETASVATHRLILKSLLVGFDLATLALVWMLLSRIGLHAGNAVIYAWCPLLIKEVANSGHLDAITVAFSTAAVLLMVLAAKRDSGKAYVGAAACLALGTAAKLFPVVLVPILCVTAWKQRGLVLASTLFIGYVAASALMLWPMADPMKPDASAELSDGGLPGGTSAVAGAAPSGNQEPAPAGLKEFLSRWEMNDPIFGFIYENIRPTRAGHPPKWYAIVPASVRGAITRPIAELFDIEPHAAGFMITRVVTLGISGLIILAFAFRIDLSRPQTIVAASAFALIWFFLLSPTLNPWYWTWALPLVAVLANRVWLVVPGVLLVYYLRFWCIYDKRWLQFGETLFEGDELFNSVIVCVEWSVFFALLIGSWLYPTKLTHGSDSQSAKV